VASLPAHALKADIQIRVRFQLSGISVNRQVSIEDEQFLREIETCEFPVADFDHRAHLRLAYIYLVQNDTHEAIEKMRDTLTRLLLHAGIEPSAKYHETLTEAWILAVHHFMNRDQGSISADQFIDQNSDMLDSKIMMTHYSAEVLFSDDARRKFVEPDLEPIPRH
jgi:hypothetical protein